MTESGDPRSSSRAPILVMAPPRDPGTFSGTDGAGVDDWLSFYERVSTYNRWDPTLMLPSITFYLQRTAKLWYERHENELTSWDTCKPKLRALFGNSDDRKNAKKQFASRAQSSKENYVAYIQDVLALCHTVDTAKTGPDNVRHVLKDIANDAFHLLVCKDCSTIDSVIKECQRLEQVEPPHYRAVFSAA